MGWDILIGQKRAKALIRKQLEVGRLPHALLFYGHEGSGMDVAAIQLAKVLNCSKKDHNITDSCDNCEDCKRVDSLQHPNVYLVFPLPVGKNEQAEDSPLDKLENEDLQNILNEIGKKANNPYYKISIDKATYIKITSIREIRRRSSLSMFGKGKKVTIILDAEKMTDAAANALLKTLEEPTGDSIFILTTANKDALLPTIISRCQLIRFDELTDEEISNALQSRESIDIQRSYIIGKLANGNYTRALEMINSDLNEKRNIIVDFLALILTTNTIKIYETIEKIIKENSREELEQLISLIKLWFRDAFMIKEGCTDIINLDQKERLEKFTKLYVKIDFNELFKIIDTTLSLIKKNVYINLVIYSLVINLRRIILKK